MSVRQYWIAYDVSDNRERVRVERCIARYGQRLQKSLFACVLDPRRYAQLQGELDALGCVSGFVALAALADPDDVVTIGKACPTPGEDWVFGVSSSAPEQPPDVLGGDT